MITKKKTPHDDIMGELEKRGWLAHSFHHLHNGTGRVAIAFGSGHVFLMVEPATTRMLRAGKWETETTGNFDVHLVVDDESVGARETKTSKDAVDLMESLRDGLGSQHRAQFEAALAG